MEPISVMIVDDSALMRNIIGRIVEETPNLKVETKAINGLFALKKLETASPDVIILDLEMPEMNGIEFLKKRKELGIEIPVIILSSIARQGAQITMEALSLGASDFILKPSGGQGENISAVAEQLRGLIFAYGGRYHELKKLGQVEQKRQHFQTGIVINEVRTSAEAPKVSPVRLSPIKTYHDLQAILIGVSTGGPNALRKVFAELSPNIKLPILVVQHMPPGFTTEFARSLDRLSPLEVKEAEDGDMVRSGRILIAPGDYHLEVERKQLGVVAKINQKPLWNGHRPSVGMLYKSALSVWGEHLCAIIMTGMGKDGSEEIGEIRRAGGLTIGQDAASSVVYGMPRVAEELGNLEMLVPLEDMASLINEVGSTGSLSPRN